MILPARLVESCGFERLINEEIKLPRGEIPRWRARGQAGNLDAVANANVWVARIPLCFGSGGKKVAEWKWGRTSDWEGNWKFIGGRSRSGKTSNTVWRLSRNRRWTDSFYLFMVTLAVHLRSSSSLNITQNGWRENKALYFGWFTESVLGITLGFPGIDPSFSFSLILVKRALCF